MLKTTRTHHMLGCLFFCLLVLAGCTGCGQKTALQTQKDTPLARSEPTAQKDTPTENDTRQKRRGDATVWQHSHHTDPNPFPIPPDVLENPHLFKVEPNGDYAALFPEENDPKYEKLGLLSGGTLQGEAFAEKRAEILAEGLSNLTAARYLSELGGAKKQARAYINKALAENPDDFETLDLWAVLHQKQKPAEAEAAYRKMLQQRPDSIRVLYGLGDHLVWNHPKPAEAIPPLKRALALNPELHIAMFNLGLAYKKLGDYAQALHYFQATAVHSPTRFVFSQIAFVKSKLAQQEKGE